MLKLACQDKDKVSLTPSACVASWGSHQIALIFFFLLSQFPERHLLLLPLCTFCWIPAVCFCSWFEFSFFLFIPPFLYDFWILVQAYFCFFFFTLTFLSCPVWHPLPLLYFPLRPCIPSLCKIFSAKAQMNKRICPFSYILFLKTKGKPFPTWQIVQAKAV